jgi:hypothetical protein
MLAPTRCLHVDVVNPQTALLFESRVPGPESRLFP